MAIIEIKRIGNNIKYLTRSENGEKAELLAEKIGDIIVIKHTEVAPVFKGQGIGKQLLDKCASDARDQGLKIHPECSFAAYQFQKTAEWSDLLAPFSKANP